MVQAYVAPYTILVTDGILTTFSYSFYIDASAEIEAYHNGSLTTAYTVTGVGSTSGGTLVFFSPPSAGTLFIRRRTPLTQLVDFVDHDPFRADVPEAAYDKLQRQIQDLVEDLSRRPQLAISVLSTLRNLVFPTPVALKLWGWNATADGITYYDPAVVQIEVDTESGQANGKTTTTVNASSGAGTAILTAANAIPAGVLLLAVTARVTTTCSNASGLTTWTMGDDILADRWGSGIARTATTVTGPGNWRDYEATPTANAMNVYLLADAGLWGATGVIKVTAHWCVFSPDE